MATEVMTSGVMTESVTTDTEAVTGASTEERDLAGVTTSEDLMVEEELLVEDELLVEEVSIDGMCGVY